MNYYGMRPEIIENNMYLEDFFGSYLLYMPIKMKGDFFAIIPAPFDNYYKIVRKCRENFGDDFDYYIYMSVETSYVSEGSTQKRPGWHCDGFMTEDVNYIIYNNHPTIFNSTKFNIVENHKISMEQFEAQANSKFDFILPCNSLIKMNPYVVHRANPAFEGGLRTFLKISFSKDKYNLKGNTQNPLIPHDWKMYDREKVRNHPQIKEVDSVPQGVLDEA